MALVQINHNRMNLLQQYLRAVSLCSDMTPGKPEPNLETWSAEALRLHRLLITDMTRGDELQAATAEIELHALVRFFTL